MLLRSVDVLHDFYVPEFRAKMDLIPGLVTYVWLTPTRPGAFQILCAELCGTGHAMMRGEVMVVEQGDYQAWLGRQRTFAQLRQDRARPLAANEDGGSGRGDPGGARASGGGGK